MFFSQNQYSSIVHNDHEKLTATAMTVRVKMWKYTFSERWLERLILFEHQLCERKYTYKSRNGFLVYTYIYVCQYEWINCFLLNDLKLPHVHTST